MIITQIDLHLYAALILAFLIFDARKRLPRVAAKDRIFRLMLESNLLLLLTETACWIFDGKAGALAGIAVRASNGLLYALGLVPITLWLAYLDEAVAFDAGIRMRRRRIYILANIAMVVLALLNPRTEMLFTVDGMNRYARTNGAWIALGSSLTLYASSLIALIPYRRSVSGRITQLILLIALIPTLGGILQAFAYGTSLLWPAMAFLALCGYLLVQREEMKRDLITSLATRSQMEERISYLLARRRPFSLVMMDLDGFKAINDTWGHEEGDTALATVANLLTKSIKQVDSAYRYAGDEFMLIIESEDAEAGKLVVERLKANLDRVNRHSGKPYVLALSAGIAYYDGREGEQLPNLCGRADDAMYREKTSKRHSR